MEPHNAASSAHYHHRHIRDSLKSFFSCPRTDSSIFFVFSFSFFFPYFANSSSWRRAVVSHVFLVRGLIPISFFLLLFFLFAVLLVDAIKMANKSARRNQFNYPFAHTRILQTKMSISEF
uniref:Transmembrane protein n=1 Tax=Caenorhabditis tropicalis TaxID=1561998 RepID=A0A1I7TXH5_9PELO